MCGLVGIWCPGKSPEALGSIVRQGMRALRHRGPDDAGLWVDGSTGVGLGQVRLAVIGTAEAAHQPMHDLGQRSVLVCNGEIYNYRSLYAERLNRSPDVDKTSDTSVLLGMLERHGAAALQALDGMFAFAHFDREKRAFLFARDRFGEKPLYLASDETCLAFASELSALRAMLPDRQWTLDREAVAAYHMIGSIPPPRTVYQGVVSLPAGHLAESRGPGSLSTTAYWSLGDNPIGTHSNSDGANGEAVALTRDRLLRATTSRMVSDVPVGIFLSGGIDSGALLATTCAADCPPAAALCMDFEGLEESEYEIARSSAEHFDVPLIRAPMTRARFSAGLETFLRVMDQPTNDGYNTHFIAQVARDSGIKVWLSGVGGDELFGGYPSFRRLAWLPPLAAAGALLRLPYRAALRFAGANPRMQRLAHLIRPGDSRLRAYQASRLILPPGMLFQILGPDLAFTLQELEELVDQLYPAVPGGCDAFQTASLLESSTYMTAQLLRDIDNFSMASSLEVRAPFLDHGLFGDVWALPQAAKSRGSGSKPLLIKSVPGGLAPSVPSDRKRGFAFPIDEWLREDLALRFRTEMADSGSSGHLNATTAARIWKDWKTGRVHWSVPWLLYAFAAWRGEHGV